MTLLSRISGLMRDIVLHYLFGASAVAAMFFVAFRIPIFFRRLLAGDSEMGHLFCVLCVW